MKLNRFVNYKVNESVDTILQDIVDLASDKVEKWIKGSPDEFAESDDRIDFVENNIDDFFDRYYPDDKLASSYINKNRDAVIAAITTRLESDMGLGEKQRYYTNKKAKPVETDKETGDDSVEEARKNYDRSGFAKYPYQMYFSDNGMADAVGAGTVKELIDNVAVKRKLKDFAIFKADSKFHSTTQEEYLVKWYDESDSSYWANRAKKEPELNKKRLKSLSGDLKLQEGEKIVNTLTESPNNPVSTVKFKRWLCTLDFGQYQNGRTAIELNDSSTGEPVAVATVNLPNEKIADDEVIIKNWSENEGMLATLEKAGVISKPIRTVETGYVEAHVCKLLVKP